jgi:hypothetical protein
MLGQLVNKWCTVEQERNKDAVISYTVDVEAEDVLEV